MRLSGQGMTAAAIRHEIDTKYSKFGKPTPTPPPPGG
jgi:hypothetical protein